VYNGIVNSPFATEADSSSGTYNETFYVQMNAGDTAQVELTVGTAGNYVITGINVNPEYRTVFSGTLLGTSNNGGGANSFPTDAGTATSLAGVLEVNGG